MAFRASDAELFFLDGELAVFGTKQFRCNLDVEEAVEQFGGQSMPGMVAGKLKMTYPTAAPGQTLKSGDALTVDGVSYKVRWSRKLDDGVLSVAELQKG